MDSTRKIKLLTFSKTPNYGALLQCYALSHVLSNYNIPIELCNIDLEYMKAFSYKIREKLLYRFVNLFSKKHLPTYCTNKITNKDDIYIVGSDQVWNLDITKGSYKKYFFDFLTENNYRFSYAASFGQSIWTHNSENNEIKSLLEKFASVSVREESGIKICKENFTIDAELVLDPTLLVSDYSNLTGPITERNTIVGYKLVPDPQWSNLLIYLSKKNNLEYIDLFPLRFNIYKNIGGLNRKYITVNTWIKNIAESSFVITDSFHGVVFSIIYKKKFIVIPSDIKRMDRVLSLLKLLNLEDRYYQSIEDIYLTNLWQEDIDFDSVHKILDIYKSKSLNYLHKNIISCL